MKKLFTIAAFLFISVAMMLTSCSTEKSITKAFVKNGYMMGILTPQQQVGQASFLSAFPSLNQDAMGYVTTENSITFIYAADDAAWSSYCSALRRAGFSEMATGYVKADRKNSVTYNISSARTTVYGQNYVLVTYAYGAL